MDVKTVTISPLQAAPEADLRRLIAGYISTERYRIKKLETDQHTEFCFDLETLDQPYKKVWALSEEDLALYARLVAEGHSLAAYISSEMVGLALVEVRQWDRTFWIWEFHVAEGYRRLGIGRRLMDALEEEAYLPPFLRLLFNVPLQRHQQDTAW